ncbi:hypothetical protein DYQ86_11005 [Acidobacteria bacterium AB60]|nr:hypothetical protein DYQ86_11005 [Acidobacteria bacterium AB60]
MTRNRIVRAALLSATAAAIVGLAGLPLLTHRVHAEDESPSESQLAEIGLKIAPSFINMQGKDPTLVGLGSFIVHAQADCNGCHGSDPANEYVGNGNPYFRKPLNSPAQFNQATYLNGGQNFGPAGPGIVKDMTSPLYGGPGLGPNIITRNLTPDSTGNPAGGVDLQRFITIVRTGHDFDKLHPSCSATVTDNCYAFPVNGELLQIMPWPNFRHMTDHQLTAIWTYLSTVPCNAHDDAVGDTFPWLKNKC